MKEDKKTLITIIVLLVIFLPMSLYGIFNQLPKDEKKANKDNPNHEFIYNNKVYFYGDNDELLNTYECQNTCEVVDPIIDDDEYNIHYYKDGDKGLDNIINNDYAIFKDGINVQFHSIKTNKPVISLLSVKNYGVIHSKPIFIMRTATAASVFSLEDMKIIINNYDFIGIPNRVVDGVMDTSKFIAKSGSLWYVLEFDGTYKHTPFRAPVVDFNDNYVVVNNFGTDRIYDYDNQEYLAEVPDKTVYAIGDYVLVISNNELTVYKDILSGSITSISLTSYKDISFTLNNGVIDVILDGKSLQNIDVK